MKELILIKKLILNDLREKFINAKSAEEAKEIILNFDKKNKELSTTCSLCFIRNSIDTKDSFYKAEKDFLDEHLPIYDVCKNKFYEEILSSKFRKELEGFLENITLNFWNVSLFLRKKVLSIFKK